MAILKTTIVSGNVFVTGSENFVSASEFRGPLTGTASWAVSTSRAVSASIADNIDPNADVQVKSLLVSGNALVNGNLQVLGDLTYVGVQDLRVKDHVIEINADESGSAVGSADGAGVIIRNNTAAGDIELIYSASDDKLHINKGIAGTVDSASEAAHAVSASRAESAASADKVQYKLKFGTGISQSVAGGYDGEQEITVDVNVSTIVNTVVSQSVSASVAQIAEQVRENLTLNFTGEDGTAAEAVVYNGSDPKSFSIDLSGLESKTHASASVADLQDQINAISGESGSGTISDRIQEALEELDADADANASGTPVSGGVFVLSGVAFNEADGKLTSGSATSVEVEKAGEAAKAKAELLGASSDATSSMTLYGIKNYVDAKTGDGVAALSESVATDIANVMASQSAASQSISSSIADVASNALNLVESSSYIAVSEKANNKQTISAKTHTVADADVTTGDGLALASDVKSYVDGKTSNAVSAEGDDWVAASAADNKVTITTNVKAIASATALDDGLAAASDVKSHVSASVAALSSSIATSDSASNARLDAVEATASANSSSIADLQAAGNTYVTTASFNSYTSSQAQVDATQSARLDALETASGSAITRLNALEAATASYANSASVATVTSASEARIEALESASAELDDLYVAKAGDTMSGDLVMGSNGIKLGDMRLVWNASEQALQFVYDDGQ